MVFGQNTRLVIVNSQQTQRKRASVETHIIHNLPFIRFWNNKSASVSDLHCNLLILSAAELIIIISAIICIKSLLCQSTELFVLPLCQFYQWIFVLLILSKETLQILYIQYPLQPLKNPRRRKKSFRRRLLGWVPKITFIK